MKTKITQEELNKILKDHKKKLSKQHDTVLHLHKYDLSGLSFARRELANIDMHNCNLSNTNFKGCKLVNIDFNESNLQYANFTKSSLSLCNFIDADLSFVDFSNCSFNLCELMGATLICTKFYYITDTCTYDHTGLFNSLTDIRYAFFDTNNECRKGIILGKDAVGYKQLKGDKIAKLLIPVGNVVFSINNYKCRTPSAKVLEITSFDGSTQYKTGHSLFDDDFIYRVGRTVKSEEFYPAYNSECAPGIHFFRTIEEAKEYDFN